MISPMEQTRLTESEFVASTEKISISLPFGDGQCFQCDVATEQVVAHYQAPSACADIIAEIQRAMEEPLNFPPLSQTVVSGDLVAIALDRTIPHAAPIIAAVWAQLALAGIRPDDVTIIQAADEFDSEKSAVKNVSVIDPRSALPKDVRDVIQWVVHDPHDKDACRYLATAANDERIYVAGAVVDADAVVTIGQISFDPLLGYAGTHSLFYPELSNAETIARTRGQGQRELSPDDERSMRQLVDEVGWLVGSLFTVQCVPAANGDVATVLAGDVNAVLQEGKQLLRKFWTCQVEERPDIVVAAIENNPRANSDVWKQFGAVLNATRNLVAHDGKVLILTEMQPALGEGMQKIRHSQNRTDSLDELNAVVPHDFVVATQLLFSVDWSNVYLLSRFEESLVDDLLMTPIANTREAARLIDEHSTCVFIEAAQSVHTEIEDS